MLTAKKSIGVSYFFLNYFLFAEYGKTTIRHAYFNGLSETI